MHFPLWLLFALITLIFWGTTGVTQKLSTNAISTESSFLWFVVAFLPIALVIVLVVPLDWHIKTRVYCLAIVGGARHYLPGSDSAPRESHAHRNCGNCARARRCHPALSRGAA